MSNFAITLLGSVISSCIIAIFTCWLNHKDKRQIYWM
ncbi:type I toxin-antitoxin system Fst family toxin [Lactococcus ileimucosae]